MADWRRALACPHCKQTPLAGDAGLTCAACARTYPVIGGVPRFLDDIGRADLMASPDGDAMVRGYRAPSRLAQRLRKVVSSEYFPGNAWRAARAATLAAADPGLVIGSGVTRLPNCIHLDIDDFAGVDVVGDAHHLPIADGAVRAVICETVLEHITHPEQVIAEVHRVLHPGGRFFFIVPFVFPFHGHPNDYRRWSAEGLTAAFSAFSSVETGIHAGPCSAMVNLLSEWGYVLSGRRFPTGYVPIKGALTALLFPLKFLDTWVNRFPEAHRLAATLYVTGVR